MKQINKSSLSVFNNSIIIRKLLCTWHIFFKITVVMVETLSPRLGRGSRMQYSLDLVEGQEYNISSLDFIESREFIVSRSSTWSKVENL